MNVDFNILMGNYLPVVTYTDKEKLYSFFKAPPGGTPCFKGDMF
jgi:hypothetical protein